jgi:hypothetical protein
MIALFQGHDCIISRPGLHYFKVMIALFQETIVNYFKDRVHIFSRTGLYNFKDRITLFKGWDCIISGL